MLTKDDLKAIAETISPLIKAEGELTRKEVTANVTKEVKNYIQANNSVLGKIIRIELAEQRQEIVDVMKAGFQEVGKIVRKSEERITALEKQRSPVRN